MTTILTVTTILTDWRTVTKLTDANGQSHGGCQWGPNVENPKGVLSGKNGLCGAGFYHGYHTPELAAFLNPRGADFQMPQFWLAEIRGTVEVEREIMKLGATEMRTVREIPAIVPTTLQRVAFTLYVASATLDSVGLAIPKWEEWRDNWFVGTGPRTYAAAYAANAAAANADACAAYAAYNAAADAAYAAYAANAAADILVDASIFALSEGWER